MKRGMTGRIRSDGRWRRAGQGVRSRAAAAQARARSGRLAAAGTGAGNTSRWAGWTVISTLLPDTSLFLYAGTSAKRRPCCRRKIEGTQSSLSDLLLFELDEAPGCRSTTWWRCRTTSRRSTTGWRGCASDLPLSNRLIREIHGAPLARAWQRQTPGRVPALAELDRRHAARERALVPPPHDVPSDCMTALERLLARHG